MNRAAIPLALILIGCPGVPAADPPVKSLEEQMQKLIEEVSPTVVSVVVSHQKYPDGGKGKPGQLGDYTPAAAAEDFRPWPRRGTPAPPNRLDLSLAENAADNLFGSGVVLDAKAGLILVPYHLIEGATKVYVRSSAGKGSYADIRAADSKSDLAVLKLIDPPAGMTAVTLADVQLVDAPDGKKPNLKRGSWAVAVGHPLAAGAGDGNASASWGIVSNVGRRSAPTPPTADRTPKPLHTYGGLIQLDARITLGSSGAAVFNLSGQLVALGSSVAAVYGSDANGGYAVPMDANYRRIVAALQAGREVEYGFLGITPTEEARGVGASSVSPGCPAADAGFRGGDVITSIDGHPLKHPDDLLLYIGAALAGSEVTLEYLPQGRGPTRTAKVTLAKNSNPLPFLASVPPPSSFGLRVEYQSTKFAGPVVGFGQRPQQNPTAGVVIRDTPEPGSPADVRFQGAGSPRGYWVITHVDGKPVATPSEYYAAVKGKSSVKLVLADSEDPTNRQTITLP